MQELSKKTILLVEDEALIAIVEKRILEKFGYNVLTSRTGEQAVDTLHARADIDLVLMDIDLGEGIDGTEAAKRMLALRELPVVFLSSHTEPEYVTLTEGISSYGYIVKNSGETILNASIKMAFRLFESKMREREHEAALRRDRERSRALLDALPDLMFVMDQDGTIIDFHPGGQNKLYRPPEEFLNRPVEEVLPPQLAQLTKTRVAKVLANGTPQLYEYALTIDDELRYFESRLVRSGATHALSIVRDITDQKLDEAELHIQNAHLKAIFSNTHDAMVYFDTEHNISNANRRFSTMFGHELEDVLGRNINEVVDPEHRATEYASPRILQGESVDMVAIRYTKDKQPLRVSLTGGPVVVKGQIVGGYAIYASFESTAFRQAKVQELLVDIGARCINIPTHEVERAIESALEQIGTVVGADGVYIFEYDFHSGVCRNTHEWCRPDVVALRAEEQEIPLDAFPDLVSKHVAGETISISDIDLLPPGPIKELLSSYRLKSLLAIPMMSDTECLGFVGFDSAKDNFSYTHADRFLLAAFVQMLTSVRLRAQAEDALRLSEERRKLALDNAGHGIWDWNLVENRMYHSPGGKAILGYEDHELENTYEAWFSKVHPDDVQQVQQDIDRHLDGSSPMFQNEHRLQCKDGEYRWVLSHGKIVTRSSEGRPLRAVGTVTDISEHKQAQERVASLLREKQLLLKETHHRIKNNMGVIHGLLSMQAELGQDGPSAAVLKDAAGRMRSMMVLYDKLYRSETHDRLNIHDYLPPLVEQIVGLFPGGDCIELSMSVQDYMVGAKALSSLGIIVNELITNSMKHAFPNLQHCNGCKILLGAVNVGEQLILNYADNGVGLPASVDPRNTGTFGMQLISMLVEELKGTLRVTSSEGTQVELSFPVATTLAQPLA